MARALLVLLLTAAAWAELPLGAPGLPESRTEEQLAPGLRYTRIVRGRVDPTQRYTVQVAVVPKAEVEPTLQRIKAMGLEGWQRPAGDQVSVRIGRIELRPFADDLERKVRAQFPEAKVLHMSDDPEADQGPWVVHVLEVDWDDFKGRVEPTVGRGPNGFQRTPLTELAQAALAAVNGDYFVEREEDGTPGDPTGILLIHGRLLSEARPGRTALVVDSVRRAFVAQLDTQLSLDGRRVDGVNRKPGLRRDEVAHDTTARVEGEVVLDDWEGKVNAVVLQVGVPGESGTRLAGNGYSAIGGGPQLLRDAEVAVRAREEGFERILYTFGLRRNPRTLAGVTDDGRLLLVVVDGRQPDWSVGATFEESARILQSLGARDGLNLDGGGSSTMVIRGEVVNRPSEGKPRAIGDAIVIKAAQPIP